MTPPSQRGDNGRNSKSLQQFCSAYTFAAVSPSDEWEPRHERALPTNPMIFIIPRFVPRYRPPSPCNLVGLVVLLCTVGAISAAQEDNDAAPKLGRKVQRLVPQGSVWLRWPFKALNEAPALGRELDEGFAEGVAEGFSLDSPESDLLRLDWNQPLRDLKYDTWRHTGNRDEYEGSVSFRLEDIVVSADRLTRDTDSGEVVIEGNVSVIGEKSRLTARRLYYQFKSPEGEEFDAQAGLFQTGTIKGDSIHLIEPHRELKTRRLEYDLANETGVMVEPRGRSGGLYFYAKKMEATGPWSFRADDAWVTTCEKFPPHYKLRVKGAEVHDGRVVSVNHARLQFGPVPTPLYVPRFRRSISGEDQPVTLDFAVGRDAGIGYWYNMGIWHSFTPSIDLALRFMPTTNAGIGGGIDGRYNFGDKQGSILRGASGQFHTLYTNEERGYGEYYHHHQLGPHTMVTGQAEQWSDRDFVNDFFHDDFRDRTAPRTFVDLTHARGPHIVSISSSASTHDFGHGTEKLPEVSYHILERRLFNRFYFSLDSVSGYYESVPALAEVTRLDNVARLSYDMNFHQGFNVTPFVQFEGTWYSDSVTDPDPDYRASGTGGVTVQSRLQRTYGGALGFSGFKHIVLPSVTVSHRPESTLDVQDAHRLDLLDDRPARTRVESQLDNIFLARDAETESVWEVMRLTLYQGNDLWNDINRAEAYEFAFTLRPRAWWGVNASGEHRVVEDDPAFIGTEYDRLAASVLYDVERWNARLGFNYLVIDKQEFNREILYSYGYKLNSFLSAWFEHRYDLDLSRVKEQVYELRTRFHRWETAVKFRDRERGFDVKVNFSLLYSPGPN